MVSLRGQLFWVLRQSLASSHGPLDVSFDIRPLLVFALVIELLAFAEADQDFRDAPFVEVQLQRYQRQPFLFGLIGKSEQLSFLNQ